MNDAQMAAAFNEWMRRYTEEPEKFMRDFQQVNEFLKDVANGKEPSYGQECAEYLRRLSVELEAKNTAS